MKIYKITEASEYIGVSINTLKTLANNGKINSFKTTRKHRKKAYHWLASEMSKEPKDTHIGMFSVDECKKVIECCKKLKEDVCLH